jgi:mannose-6-phosphate isomerase-like protein (cupin superfamily)
MFVKEFTEGEPFRCAGNEYVMLLPRDETGSCEAVLQMVRPGGATPPNSHGSFLQIYLIWSGEAKIFIGEEVRQVKAPAVALVPAQAEHWVENPLQDKELHYLYISIWPKGIPPEEQEGGWKKVYEKIIDSYVSRGYPVDAEK